MINLNKLITIFGSCRQYSINKQFATTSIQEGVTYPHYTKEVLQTVKFLKNIDNYDNLNYCFRTEILNRSRFTDEQINKFREEFDRTDVFVIEIASRIAYEYNNTYIHHIASEEKYNVPIRNDIKIRDQTDEEIENDINEIISLLSPKPIIIVSHICTYSTGKRYELTKLLQKICEKKNISFFNPSVLLEKYSLNDLFINENVLTHYTEFGHNIVSLEYKRLIDNIN